MQLNPSEAHPGYYAALKSDAKPKDGGNICRGCDWRPQCDGKIYRCMPHEIETDDGVTLKRDDGCSVLFKKIAQEDLFLTNDE